MKKVLINQQFENLKSAVAQYKDKVLARRGYAHSSNAAVKVNSEGVKGLATVRVDELITIVRTAQTLSKHVMLEVTGDNLVIQMVDRYPSLPAEFYF